MAKFFRILAWVITVVFVVFVGLPLLAERLSVSHEYKSYFYSFQLRDQSGKMHNGFFAHGKYMGFYTEGLQYGYEAPEEKDLTPWRKTVPDKRRYEYARDGFYWSDKGFLWAGSGQQARSKKIFNEGIRLNREIPLYDQTELLLPGAAIDAQSPSLSNFGQFPEYRVNWEDDYFKFDLLYKARTKGWYLWNEGKPFRTGDFGLGSMNELAFDVRGTVVHKKADERFDVAGTGLFEDAQGMPWSWFEWGPHDWMDMHFTDGWSAVLWKANDDWQWGYNGHPELGWIYDPDREAFYTFYRVEIMDKELTDDALNDGFDYPKWSKWRAIAAEGTLDVTVSNISYGPILAALAFSPWTARLSYGTNRAEGRFIRRDGTVIELKNGFGTMEHFMRFFPDFVFWGPILLILLTLSWGAASISKRVKEKKAWRNVVWLMTGLAIATLWLYWVWRF